LRTTGAINPIQPDPLELGLWVMHNLKSVRIQLLLLVTVAGSMLIHSMITESRTLAMAGTGLVIFCMLMVIFQWFVASLA